MRKQKYMNWGYFHNEEIQKDDFGHSGDRLLADVHFLAG